MNLYLESYLNVLKRNFMLVVIASVLLFVTFFIWAGVPLFVIEFTSNFVIAYLCISLSGGFLFSLYFVPFNLKVAKKIGEKNGNTTAKSFVYLQTTFSLVCSIIFAIVMGLIMILT